ncbi:MAG: ComEC/Rec2 family competence protein [Isosphaeraceae bacterium]
MDLYCVDVGQGTCNVLVLPGGRAVVVDCGPRGKEIITLLKRCRVSRIERLILSHNDSDHIGGAAIVLEEYRNAIGEIWFLRDSRLFKSKPSFWDKIDEHLKKGYLRDDQLVRLELLPGNQPRRIFEDSAASVTVKLFAPSYVNNLRADRQKSPNSTSGIVVLTKGSRRVVFSGDAGITEWRGVYEARKSTYVCDVLAVPHHGGKAGEGKQIAWLYQNAVSAHYAVISVGSANQHRHPRKDVVSTLTGAGACVMCTQITERCCNNLEAFRREGDETVQAGRSLIQPSSTDKGRSQHVACAGTVVIRFHGDRLIVQRLRRHRSLVDKLRSEPVFRGHPLCRLQVRTTRANLALPQHPDQEQLSGGPQ